MPWPVCRIIPSAFRLQPAADFTLEVNRTALPSLMDPGIDWLYLSPVLGVEWKRGPTTGTTSSAPHTWLTPAAAKSGCET